jgi:RNA polymerase sigma-70 factor (ECF subfamily)
MTSDEARLLQYRAGSREALEDLFERYRGPLYGFFRRRLIDGERAEDLTQEVFVAVIRGSEKYEPRASVKTYLYGIAMKLLLSERRRHQKRTREVLSIEPVEYPPFDSVMWLQQALGKLDETDREILMLREYEQLSYDEIATVLGTPLNTVRSRLFRARMALRKLLDPQEALTLEAPK